MYCVSRLLLLSAFLAVACGGSKPPEAEETSTLRSLAEEDREEAEADGGPVEVRSSESRDAAPQQTTTETGIPQCDAYLDAVDRYIGCAKVPAAARDATRKAIEQSRQAWRSFEDSNPEARESAAAACEQGLDALTTASKAIGCAL